MENDIKEFKKDLESDHYHTCSDGKKRKMNKTIKEDGNSIFLFLHCTFCKYTQKNIFIKKTNEEPYDGF